MRGKVLLEFGTEIPFVLLRSEEPLTVIGPVEDVVVFSLLAEHGIMIVPSIYSAPIRTSIPYSRISVDHSGK